MTNDLAIVKARMHSVPSDEAAKSCQDSLIKDKVFIYDRQWPLYEICDLSPAIHEMLLVTSVRLLMKTLLKTDAYPDIQTYVNLASVCQHFHTILIKCKSLTRKLKHYLTAVCGPYGRSLGAPLVRLTLTRHRRNIRLCAVAKLDNKLYVVFRESDTIDVYTTQPPFRQLSSIHVSGLKNPQDIAACSVNNCLYVADWAGWCVFKVEVTGDKIYKLLIATEMVRSVTVTSEGHIVMLSWINDVMTGNDYVRYGRVDIYRADGVQLSSVNLPDDLLGPRCVVQTVNKSFIVSHGRSFTKLQRVCEVNSAGVLVKSYGGSGGSGPGQLDGPEYIALDTEGRVFVADTDNRRIVLLDKQLNFQRVLLSWSLYFPQHMLYDQQTKQLIVLLTSGQVEIYTLF